MPAQILQSDRILVLSPHLDDAALSVGGIIDRATKSGKEVVIATTFTADPPPMAKTSPLIDFLHGMWKLGDSPIRFRREEDLASAKQLRARPIHGNLPDAVYRVDGDAQFLYPSRTAVFSEPSPTDPIYPLLRARIVEWLEDLRPDVVLCPLAVGRHVDHSIVSEVFRAIALERNLNVFLYEDMPYSTGRFPPESPDTVSAAFARTRWQVEDAETVEIDIDRKVESILAFKSQIQELFPETPHPESVLKRLITPEPHEAPFFEKVWRAAT